MNETARIEAFSDGIFSIAATLLVLELKPPAPNIPFWHALLLQWPGYVSFVLSFFFIGIMWINHHRLFSHIKKADDLLMAVNLLLLLGVVFVPYPTELMAASISSISMLNTPYARNVAIFYNATYLGIALLFNLVMYVCRKRNLMDDHEGHEHAHEGFSRYIWGPVVYTICLIVTWWNVPVSLAINAALAIYFLMPPGHRKHQHQHSDN